MVWDVMNYFKIYNREHVNPLNAELKPICHLLALLRAHHIIRISRMMTIPEHKEKI